MRPADSRFILLCFAASLALACGGSVASDSDGGTDAGAPTTCGNGVLDPGEECDDGNRIDFDGCSATCHVEESQRINWMEMEFATDSVCTANVLGESIVVTLAQTQLQTAITNGIGNGTVNILLTQLGTPDATGADDSSITIGVLGGTPQQPTGAPTYNGASDLDWWYAADPNSVDSTGAPLAKLTASIAGEQLTAGPGSLTLQVSFGSGVASMALSETVVQAPIGSLSAPLEATAALPPGHLAAEHVSPALRSFASTGAPNDSGAGTLCGHVSAKSLAAAMLPSQVVGACTDYTTSNSLLDLEVGGCKAYGVVTAVTKTQPDQVDPSQPAAGAGAPYALSASSGVTVDTCKDKSGATVDFNTCLAAAAYSSYFKFATDRVIIKP